VAFVMLVQGASGVAKDLSKMSSKSAVKLLAPTEGGRAVPLGGASDRIEERGEGARVPAGRRAAGDGGLQRGGAGHGGGPGGDPAVGPCRHAAGPAHGRKGAKFSEVFSKSPNVNWLSAARVIPVRRAGRVVRRRHPDLFLRGAVGRHEEGNRAAFFMIGTFMAVWIILYGAVQAAAPRF
jgi:hypothetical protein